MIKFYSALLEKRPIVTKTLTGGILSFVGDVITQLCKNVIIKL